MDQVTWFEVAVNPATLFIEIAQVVCHLPPNLYHLRFRPPGKAIVRDSVAQIVAGTWQHKQIMIDICAHALVKLRGSLWSIQYTAV